MFVKCTTATASRVLLRQSQVFLALSSRIPQTKPHIWQLFVPASQACAYSDAKGATEIAKSLGRKARDGGRKVGDAVNKFTLFAKKIPKLAVFAIVILGDLGFAYWCNRKNEEALLHAFEYGSCPEPDVKKEQLIYREAVVKNLHSILKPDPEHNSYHLVVGEHGTGKTTVVRQSVRDMDVRKDGEQGTGKTTVIRQSARNADVPKGVIYVDVPPVLDHFVDNLAKAISYNEHVTYMETLRRKLLGYAESTSSKFYRVLDAFERGAQKYKAKHKRPPVLILDNISKLSKKNVDMMEDLQDLAKLYADQSSCIIVFVSSEGTVPRLMAQRSSWSRADPRPIVIGDLSEKEALEYLHGKLGIKEENANRLFQLLGGRIRDLKTYGDRINKKEEFEEVRRLAFSVINKNFHEAKMMENQENHDDGTRLIRELLKKKHIHLNTFVKLVKKENAEQLLRANVFSYNPANDMITFQSRATEVFVKEHPELFNSK